MDRMLQSILIPTTIIGLVLCFLIIGCSPSPPELPVSFNAPGNVTITKEIGRKWICEKASGDTTGCDCIKGYSEYPDKKLVRKYLQTKSVDEVNDTLKSLPHPKDLPAKKKIELLEIARALTIEHLLRDFHKRPMTAILVSQTDHGDYIQRIYLIRDPVLGENRVLYLTPKGQKKYPIVLALHGHGTNPDVFINDLHGKDYPKNGFAIIAPTHMANCNDESEDRISRKLLQAGATKIGLHVIESLNALKLATYLYQQEQVEMEPCFAIVGHSSGAGVGLLTARLMGGRVSGAVFDVVSRYHEVQPDKKISSSMCPALYLMSNSLMPLPENPKQPTTMKGQPFPILQLPREGINPQSGQDYQAEIFRFLRKACNP